MHKDGGESRKFMTQDEFEKICITEGVTNQTLIRKMWKDRPTDNLDKNKLIIALHCMMAKFPEWTYKDQKSNGKAQTN